MTTKAEYKPKSWYIKLIHIAKSQLQLDDDLYRANLNELTGKRSCSAMTIPELFKVLEHMKKSGFKVQSKAKPKLNGSHAKLYSLWQEMADAGFVKDRSYSALESWAKANCKAQNDGVPVTKLEWFTSNMYYQAIEQLKRWFEREGKKERGSNV
jgi:phage gp16-like protein